MNARSGFENDLIKDEVSGGSTGTSDAASATQADETWDEHYRDERDAAYLYRALAAVERNPEPVDLFSKLAVVEDRHRSGGRSCSARADVRCPRYRTARRTRLLAWAARRSAPRSFCR